MVRPQDPLAGVQRGGSLLEQRVLAVDQEHHAIAVRRLIDLAEDERHVLALAGLADLGLAVADLQRDGLLVVADLQGHRRRGVAQRVCLGRRLHPSGRRHHRLPDLLRAARVEGAADQEALAGLGQRGGVGRGGELDHVVECLGVLTEGEDGHGQLLEVRADDGHPGQKSVGLDLLIAPGQRVAAPEERLAARPGQVVGAGQRRGHAVGVADDPQRHLIVVGQHQGDLEAAGEVEVERADVVAGRFVALLDAELEHAHVAVAVVLQVVDHPRGLLEQRGFERVGPHRSRADDPRQDQGQGRDAPPPALTPQSIGSGSLHGDHGLILPSRVPVTDALTEGNGLGREIFPKKLAMASRASRRSNSLMCDFNMNPPVSTRKILGGENVDDLLPRPRITVAS